MNLTTNIVIKKNDPKSFLESLRDRKEEIKQHIQNSRTKTVTKK